MRIVNRYAAILVTVAVALAQGCGTAPAPSATPLATPTTTPRPRPRVVVLSLAGAGDSWVDAFMEDGTMPNLAALAERGARSEHLQPVDPPLSLPVHISIATGAYPSVTGQVSDRFHVAGDPVDKVSTTVEEQAAWVEPLWRTAMRYGMTTATVLWPGTSAPSSSGIADYTVAHGVPEVDAARHIVETAEAVEWEDPPPSFSPLLEGVLPIENRAGVTVARLHMLVTDGTDDDAQNYDTVYLSTARRIGNDSAPLGVGQWAPLEIRDGHCGGYIKLLSVTQDQIDVFQTALWYTHAWPTQLLREIDDKYGHFPGDPDGEALEEGWITAQDYWDMVQRQARWIGQVVSYVVAQYRPDLTFAWIGVTEQCEQQFLMADEAQADYSAETVQQYGQQRRDSYALADKCVEGLLLNLLLGKDTLFVVSDHGWAPVHSEVWVNEALRRAGLVRLGEDNLFLDGATTQAWAVASGAAVHVYINLEGREPSGGVAQNEYKQTQDEIVSVLQGITGSSDEPAFQRVLPREELSLLHLDSSNSGDVFAQAVPGYGLCDLLDRGDVLRTARQHGQAGYDSADPAMRGILVAAGYGIKSGVALPPANAIDLAPTIAALLRLDLPSTTEGRLLDGMLLEAQ